MNLWSPGGKAEERYRLGSRDGHVHAITLKTDNQQGSTV